MEQKKDKILHDILKAYGDLKKPNFEFVMRSYNSPKYQKLLDELHLEFKIEDNTDLNCNTCISLHLPYCRKSVYVYISLVSPYAFLFYERKVMENDDSFSKILLSHNFVLLNKSELLDGFDIDASSFGIERKKATVLELLFSFGLSL